MGKIRKVLALVIALVMTFSMVSMVFAQETEGTAAAGKGNIGITNAKAGETYKAYRLFDATVALGNDGKSTGINYRLRVDQSALPSGFSTYFNVDAAGNVSITDAGKDTTDNTQLSADAIAFLKTNYAAIAGSSTPVATHTMDGTPGETPDEELVFQGLDYGYYFIDSTTGTVVTINSTNPNASVTDKNEVPGQEKKITAVQDVTTAKAGRVYEDGDSSTAGINDIIKYTVTITAHKGAENYIFHDVMSDGITLISDDNENYPLTITSQAASANNATTLTENTHYTKTAFANVVSSDVDTDDITITFDKTNYLDSITEDTTITLTYYGRINESAIIESTGNPNKSRLEYGHKDTHNYTPWDIVKTYVFDFNVHKYTGDNAETGPALAGVKFVLSASSDLGDISLNSNGDLDFATSGKSVSDLISLHMDDSNYEKDLVTPNSNALYIIETNDSGNAVVQGLDQGTYYLYEVATLDGYNKLTAPIKVEVVAEKDGQNKLTGADTVTVDNVAQQNDKVDVRNESGSTLPSTGGMGTTIFYVIGGILVLAAAIILISKRRVQQ